MKTMREIPVKDLYPALFDGPYYLGTSIHTGWRSIVIDVCVQIMATLSPADLKLFHFLQIKEKFGGLCMYFDPTNTTPVTLIGSDSIVNFEMPKNQDSQEPALSAQGHAQVREVIRKAVAKASRTCEVCGSDGRLYAQDYWKTLCDLHAQESERVFPKAYGVILECPSHTRQFEGRKAIGANILYFKDSAAYAWNWASEPKKRHFVFLDDLPNTLVRAYLNAKDGKFRIACADPDAPNRLGAIYARDFIRTLNRERFRKDAISILEPFYALPPKVRVDARTQLERDIADVLDLDVAVKSLIPAQAFGGLALGVQRGGMPTLFNSALKLGPKRIDSPRLVLESQIKKLERLKARLEAVLQAFDIQLP